MYAYRCARYPRLRLTLALNATSLVLAVALSGCLADNQTTSGSSRPTATATSRVSGPVPQGTPVVLYWRSVTPDGLYATSWGGALYKIPTLNFGPGSPVVQSPDGSRLAIGDKAYDTTSGAPTQLPLDAATADAVDVTWGDDSRHVCLVRRLPTDGSPSEISFGLPGSPAKVLGRFGSQGQQLPGATVLACSATTNRVVVANVGYMNDTSDVWVLDATTGATKSHRSYPTTSQSNGNIGSFVVASPDGQYLAETDAATGSATIRGIADGSVVARLSGMEVHGFSSHGHLVLAAPRSPGVALENASLTNPVVVDWRTGKTVWRSPVGAGFAGRLAAQPSGEGIALDLDVGQRHSIWLVGADGPGRAVDNDAQFLVTVLVGLV